MARVGPRLMIGIKVEGGLHGALLGMAASWDVGSSGLSRYVLACGSQRFASPFRGCCLGATQIKKLRDNRSDGRRRVRRNEPAK